MGKRPDLAQLEHTVTLVQKRWGARALRKANEHDRAEPAVLSTGFESVDRLLDPGGLPRGRITELIASGTAGQISLAAMTLGQAQRHGLQTAVVDMSDSIDPDFVVRCGVHLDTLIILKPWGLGQAVQMMDDLLRENGVGAVLFDRLHPMLSAKDVSTLDRALRQWLPILDRSRCTLIFYTETVLPGVYPQGLSLPYFASLRLAFEREDWVRHRRRVVGVASRVTVVKSRSASIGRSVRIEVSLNGSVHEG